jgi:hypothetical protein
MSHDSSGANLVVVVAVGQVSRIALKVAVIEAVEGEEDEREVGSVRGISSVLT